MRECHSGIRPGPESSAAGPIDPPDTSIVQLPLSPASPPSRPAARANAVALPILAECHRTQIPEKYRVLEPLPIIVYDDNPVFNEHGAAQIVGVSAELLKKWRQRRQGPDYIQYGRGGPIRYELSALKAFRAAHRVQVKDAQS